MDSSKPDGVVMGILPSQYKNMTGYSYLENEARTIRGQMKFLIGDSFITQLTYSGILQSSPSVENSDKAKLQEYVDSFMKDYGPENGELTKEANVQVNTYDSGKRMNRAVQVMEKEFLSTLKIGRNKFEAQLGLANGYVSSKGASISSDVIEKTLIAYPILNAEWLLTGKGNMLVNLDDAIEGEELNPDLTLNANTRPRVPLTAAAGSLSGESIGVTLEQCEQMPLIHQIPAYDFTMFIKGDSMSPRFESGDEIACRHIDQSRFIQWGKVHVLDTTQGFVIKRVYEDGNKIRCVSYNPEYADFSIPKEDILSMSLVVGVVSIMEM